MSEEKFNTEEPGQDSDPLAGLSAAQRRLLEFRLKKRNLRPASSDRIPHRPTDKVIQLSLAQERFWFLEQLEEGHAVYNRAQAFRLTGGVEVWALRQSLNAILARHEILRMAIPSSDGRPAPYIEPSLEAKLDLADLASLPLSNKEAEAKRIACEEAERPFDLGRAPLLRAKLIRLSMEEHVLVLVIHHLVSDAWSDSIFWKEFEQFYNSLVSKSPCHLEDLPLQYLDFATWQRQLLQAEAPNRHLNYWKEHLGENRPVLKLPADHLKTPESITQYPGESLFIEQNLVNDLRALGQRVDATLFMTLLAAFLALLYRYSNQEDILVGITMAGRDRVELERLMGLFVKTLVLRHDMSGEPSFQELLRRVRKVALNAYAHQDIPFEKLLQELNPERNLHSTPLFQTYFNFRNIPKFMPALQKLKVQRFEFDYGAPLSQVDFNITEREDGLLCELKCDATLFEKNMPARMLNQYCFLLKAVLERPDCALSELPLLTSAEQSHLLREWRGVKPVDNTPVELVQSLCEKQVRNRPAKVAVVFENRVLTYDQLNEHANYLAEVLHSRGVGPEVIVGVCMERSLELIIAILGILKSGATYLPLDPDNPRDRLNFIVEEARPAVILTQSNFRQRLEELPVVYPIDNSFSSTLLFLDQDLPEAQFRPDVKPRSNPETENLAYVIYTSGSTGKPKGVMVSHRALGSYVRSATDTYGIRPEDRILQFSSFGFDASVEEIFCCLTTGGTLVLRSDSMLESPAIFLEKCHDWGITVLSLPTAYWHELAGQLECEHLTFPSCLRLMIIGGERASPNRLASWKEHGPAWVQLINTYGPTEATVVATAWKAAVSLKDVREMVEVPIGHSLPHVQSYVLGKGLQPVPIGMPGELFLGGTGLARGYLNRPELAKERFVLNPHSLDSAERLYRTGDRVRYRADGNLEFLGRFDQQVKIRGFRIELGEIECVLGLHPQVAQAVVVTRQDNGGDKRLVTYVVLKQGQAATVNELRNFLKQKLPDYMVPSSFVFLDRLPLTPNGKVDRKALPAPDSERPDLGSSFVAPRTPTEKLLAGIWCQLLELTQIGVEDNFFDLGGHSLLALQMISRVRNTFQVELPVRRLFETPTVAGLAMAVVEYLVEKNAAAEDGPTLDTLDEFLNVEGEPSPGH